MFLPGEEKESPNLTDVYFIMEDRRKAIFGNIHLTNMRISFYPKDTSLRMQPQYNNINRFFNFFDIPISLIQEVTIAETPSDLNNVEPSSCFFLILCKNFRIITVCLSNPGSDKYPSLTTSPADFFAFKELLRLKANSLNIGKHVDLIMSNSEKWWNENRIEASLFNKSEYSTNYIPDFMNSSDWNYVIKMFNASSNWYICIDPEYSIEKINKRQTVYVDDTHSLSSSMLDYNNLSNKSVSRHILPILKMLSIKKSDNNSIKKLNFQSNTCQFHLKESVDSNNKNLCDIRCYPQILPVKMNLVEWQILCSSAIATLPPIWHFSHPQKKTSIVTLPTLLKDVLQDSQSSSSIRTVDQNKIKKKINKYNNYRPIKRKNPRVMQKTLPQNTDQIYGRFISMFKQKQITFIDLSVNPCTLVNLQSSYIHLMAISFSYEDTPKWFQLLSRTKWLHYVSEQLELVNRCIDRLVNHISDIILKGSERDFSRSTASLLQIVLFPQYRTIQGFNDLIAREWNSLGGHHWLTRSGLSSDSSKPGDNVAAPVFLFFLDCVYQLCEQNPFDFEFTQSYLRDLWDSVTSCYHNTFTFNSLPERMRAWMNRSSTNMCFISAFDFNAYMKPTGYSLLWNPFYIEDNNTSSLYCSSQLKDLSFWVDMYCRHRWRSYPLDRKYDILKIARSSLQQEANVLHSDSKNQQSNQYSNYRPDSMSMTWLSDSISTRI